GGSEQLVLEDAFDAQLAAIDVGASRAARRDRRPIGIDADLERASGRAIAASRIAPFDHALVGDLDWIALLAPEQHVLGPNCASCPSFPQARTPRSRARVMRTGSALVPTNDFDC